MGNALSLLRNRIRLPESGHFLIGLSGGAVCLVNLAMAVYMIRRANGEIK